MFKHLKAPPPNREPPEAEVQGLKLLDERSVKGLPSKNLVCAPITIEEPKGRLPEDKTCVKEVGRNR